MDEFEKDLNETQDLPVESAETPQEDAADAVVASEDAAHSDRRGRTGAGA